MSVSDAKQDFYSELNEALWRDFIEARELAAQEHDKASVAQFWAFKHPEINL
jgi:hypothetical protein